MRKQLAQPNLYVFSKQCFSYFYNARIQPFASVDNVEMISLSVRDTASEGTKVESIRLESSERLAYADIIRVVATAQVILAHSAAPYLYIFSAKQSWWLASFLDAFSRVCVPLFFMISGMLLLKGESFSLTKFFKRRAFRVLAPALVWSLVYAFWSAHSQHLPLDYRKLLPIIGVPAYYHLGFINLLLCLYLITPILKRWTKQATNKEFLYFSSLWYLQASVLPSINQLWGPVNTTGFLVATGVVGFFVLGYALRNVVLVGKYRTFAAVACVSLVCFSACMTFWCTERNDGRLNEFFFESLSPNGILYGIFAYLFLKSFDYSRLMKPGTWHRKALMSISECSFGIYLVHALILSLFLQSGMHRHLQSPKYLGASLDIFVLFSSVFILSWSFVFACRFCRIPRWIVP